MYPCSVTANVPLPPDGIFHVILNWFLQLYPKASKLSYPSPTSSRNNILSSSVPDKFIFSSQPKLQLGEVFQRNSVHISTSFYAFAANASGSGHPLWHSNFLPALASCSCRRSFVIVASLTEILVVLRFISWLRYFILATLCLLMSLFKFFTPSIYHFYCSLLKFDMMSRRLFK